MKLIFALLFILLILILTYYIYKSSSIYYAKTNKESLICKIRCSSRTSVFFLVFSIIIILLLIDKIMNFSTFTFYYLFAFMYLPQYILFLLSDTTIFIFKDRIISSNNPIKFSNISKIEIKPTKGSNKFSLLITQGKSTYVETIFSNGREKLIEILKPLLDENTEFIY
ncbi:DUF986 family protein [Clostridium paraputrificum]|uniref:Uncharacterized protein n=2 Tax=Clostridium paraputrificum TaxID=29363 RepID=A0A6N3GDL2_9CLOT